MGAGLYLLWVAVYTGIYDSDSAFRLVVAVLCGEPTSHSNMLQPRNVLHRAVQRSTLRVRTWSCNLSPAGRCAPLSVINRSVPLPSTQRNVAPPRRNAVCHAATQCNTFQRRRKCCTRRDCGLLQFHPAFLLWGYAREQLADHRAPGQVTNVCTTQLLRLPVGLLVGPVEGPRSGIPGPNLESAVGTDHWVMIE